MENFFEDKDLIVCYKPAGLATQTRAVGQKDMETELNNYLKGNGEKAQVFILHRLDQPVEGVMVFAKNELAAGKLSKQFANHITSKKYYAVVSADKIEKEAELTDYLIKDSKTNTAKVVSKDTKAAKEARLKYRLLEEKADKKLLDVELFTGRHHQIRVQLANCGMPIIGDAKYGGIKTGRNLALCSYHLGFIHPGTNKSMEFDIKPKGEDFQEFTF